MFEDLTEDIHMIEAPELPLDDVVYSDQEDSDDEDANMDKFATKSRVQDPDLLFIDNTQEHFVTATTMPEETRTRKSQGLTKGATDEPGCVTLTSREDCCILF